MPAIAISQEDALSVAAFVRSEIEGIGSQGKPPSAGKAPPSILVGDAHAGQVYFEAKCASCHSVTGDLKGIGARFSEPRALQTTWVAGGRRRFTPRSAAPTRRTVTAAIALPNGEKLEGSLLEIDDFVVSIGLPDGSQRTVRRDGETPKVEIHDPMQAHRDLLAVYTDKDIHDVTAYLVTVK